MQGSEPVQAARKATDTIPIVMASVGDAVGAGFVASLARPGGNVTGLTLVAATARAIERTSKKAKLNARAPERIRRGLFVSDRLVGPILYVASAYPHQSASSRPAFRPNPEWKGPGEVDHPGP
jgi:putative ABC transport system substrate-binding protein